MKPKNELIKHYDRRIGELKEVLGKLSFDNRRTEDFNWLLGKCRILISQSFGADKADGFIAFVSPIDVDGQADMNSNEHFEYRRQCLKRAVATLKKYRLEVEKF